MTEVDDVDRTILGNHDIRRALELASVAKHAEKSSGLREDLDSVVMKVGHVDATLQVVELLLPLSLWYDYL